MSDKSIAEQMREWIKAEKAHPIYRDVPYDTMCRYILEDLRQEWLDKVEALEQELKATHIYLADEKRKLAEKDAKHIRIAKVNGQKNKRIFELEAEIAEKDKEIERLKEQVEREGKPWSFKLFYDDGIYPFARIDLQIADVGVSDRVYILESDTLQKMLDEKDNRISELEAMIAKFGEDVDRNLNGKDIESC